MLLMVFSFFDICHDGRLKLSYMCLSLDQNILFVFKWGAKISERSVLIYANLVLYYKSFKRSLMLFIWDYTFSVDLTAE